MSDPMIEFVLACADEDEEVARASPTNWDSDDYEDQKKQYELWCMQWHSQHCGWRLGESLAEECECGSRERVLARCAADRAIVELWQLAERNAQEARRITSDYQAVLGADAVADALRLAVKHLANANADHPDFREEWKL